MKKAAPQYQRSSPTQAKNTAKHYAAAIVITAPAFLSGAIAMALIAWALGVVK